MHSEPRSLFLVEALVSPRLPLPPRLVGLVRLPALLGRLPHLPFLVHPPLSRRSLPSLHLEESKLRLEAVVWVAWAVAVGVAVASISTLVAAGLLLESHLLKVREGELSSQQPERRGRVYLSSWCMLCKSQKEIKFSFSDTAN